MIRTGITHGSPAWHEARWDLLTASDVPLALCEGYHKTEAERLQQRAVLRTKKLLRDDSDEPKPEHLAVARCMEAGVIEYLRQELKWEVEPSYELCKDGQCPRLGATVDAVRIVDYVEWDIEIKVSAAAAQEDCKEGGQATWALGCPAYYRLQNLAQMAVSGRPHGQIVVLHHADRHGLKVRVTDNPRNEVLIRKIRQTTVSFWDEMKRLREGELG